MDVIIYDELHSRWVGTVSCIIGVWAPLISGNLPFYDETIHLGEN